MPEELLAYNLGELGVNVTKAPTHGAAGELLQGSNVVFDNEGNKGGLRKRPGLTKLNSVQLNGAVMGGINVHYDSPGASTSAVLPNGFWAYIYSAASAQVGWLYSANGTTWNSAVQAATDVQPTSVASIPVPGGATPMLSLDGQCIFDGTNASFADLGMRSWTGGDSQIYLLQDDGATYPRCQWNTAPAAWEGSIYRVVRQQNDASSANDTYFVLRIESVTGAVAQVGEVFPAGVNVTAICGAYGKLYVTASTAATPAKWYSLARGETTWVLEATSGSANGVYILAMVVYKGYLYSGEYLINAIGSQAKVHRLTQDGTLSTSHTAADVLAAGDSAALQPFTVFDTKLFTGYFFNDVSPVGTTSTVKTFDGSTWATDLNFGSTYSMASPPQVTQLLVANGALFGIWGGTGLATGKPLITRRTTGAVWTAPVLRTASIGDGYTLVVLQGA